MTIFCFGRMFIWIVLMTTSSGISAIRFYKFFWKSKAENFREELGGEKDTFFTFSFIFHKKQSKFFRWRLNSIDLQH